MSDQAEQGDKNVEIWKVKKLIKSLEAARGNGTSMISLIIPPGMIITSSSLCDTCKMLQEIRLLESPRCWLMSTEQLPTSSPE